MRRNLLPALALACLAAACSPLGAAQTATPASGPQATRTAIPPATSLAPPGSSTLTIWLAPEFAPDPDTEAGALFAERLAAFQDANPEVILTVRLKVASGPGSLLEALSAATIAAPDALPDVVSLDSVSLHTATLKNLIVPLEGILQTPIAPDWYEHALGLTPVGESFHALPFASRADLLAYRVDRYDAPPLTWAAIVAGSGDFAFPAGDTQAGFTLGQYLSLGGELADSSGRPALDPAALAEVLSFYASAQTAGALLPNARQFTTSAETWAEFRARRAASAVAPLSSFLTDHDPETEAAAPLPTRSGSGVCFSQTWSWAIVAQDPDRQALAAAFIRWFEEPEFLGAWTEALNLLPPTRASLEAWPNEASLALASRLVVTCRPRPSEEVLATFGPPLQAAVQAVLGGTTPEAAALAAAQAVQAP